MADDHDRIHTGVSGNALLLGAAFVFGLLSDITDVAVLGVIGAALVGLAMFLALLGVLFPAREARRYLMSLTPSRLDGE